MSSSLSKQTREPSHDCNNEATTTYISIPAVASTAIEVKQGAPLMDCDRVHLVSVLESQIDAGIRENYRLSLVLTQLDFNSSSNDYSVRVSPKPNSDLYAQLVYILRQCFRPVDIALLYNRDTIALILPGGVMPINVIREDVRRNCAAFGTLAAFGMAAITCKSGQYFDSGEILLSAAESRLVTSRAQYSSQAY